MGLTPGFWKQEQKFPLWQSPYFPTTVSGGGGKHVATLFKDVFSPDLSPANMTFLDVLGNGGGPPYNVARHIVAACLNLAAGYVPATILSLVTIKAVSGPSSATTGFYNMGSGSWNDAQIVQYLTSTMD